MYVNWNSLKPNTKIIPTIFLLRQIAIALKGTQKAASTICEQIYWRPAGKSRFIF
jgi:hypothetical protein